MEGTLTKTTHSGLVLQIEENHIELASENRYSVYDHENVVRKSGIKSITELCDTVLSSSDLAKKLSHPTLNTISKYKSSDIAIQLIVYVLSSAIELLGSQSDSFNTKKIKVVSYGILDDFGGLNLPEIHYALTKGARGGYGVLYYNELKLQDVVSWINSYIEKDREHTFMLLDELHKTRRSVQDTKLNLSAPKEMSEKAKKARDVFFDSIKDKQLYKPVAKPNPRLKIFKSFSELCSTLDIDEYRYSRYLKNFSSHIELDMDDGTKLEVVKTMVLGDFNKRKY